MPGGQFRRVQPRVLETVAENVARTLARINVEEFVTVPIGAGSGLDLEQTLESLLRGFFRGLDDVDEMQSFRSITLCEIDETRYETLKWVLYRLSSTELCANVEVTLSELRLPPAPVTRRGAGPALPPSIYLTVRAVPEGGNLKIESALLTTGAKAAVMGGQVTISKAKLDDYLKFIETPGFTHGTLGKFGTTLAEMVLDERTVAGLKGCAGNHVVVVHDADASRIPWETLSVGGKFPALDGGMSRRYIAANLSVAKWLEARRENESLQVLLVVNPTEDLEGAEKEGKRVQELIGGRQHVRITQIRGKEATRKRLREEFGSGKYDILHYAGHASLDPVRVSRSGILCSDAPLTGAELAELSSLPALVFFNACESARVRKRIKRESAHVTRDLSQRIERSVGLAEAFLRGGVANYIGDVLAGRRCQRGGLRERVLHRAARREDACRGDSGRPCEGERHQVSGLGRLHLLRQSGLPGEEDWWLSGAPMHRPRAEAGRRHACYRPGRSRARYRSFSPRLY